MMKSRTPGWKFSKPHQGEITYLSLAARRRCGEQQISRSDELDADGDSSDSEDEHAVPDGDTAEDPMKDRFLDNFAELLACRKDPRFISACVAEDTGKRVKIYAARNGGFDIDLDAGSAAPAAATDSIFFRAFRTHVSRLHKGMDFHRDLLAHAETSQTAQPRTRKLSTSFL